MNFLKGLGALGFIAYFAVLATCIYGYWHNIWQLIEMVGGPASTLFIARCVGIFAFPLGIGLGLFT